MDKTWFWLDLEMSGLDEKQHRILEVAALLTNPQLEEKAMLHEVVYQPPEVLAAMDEWCTKTHGASGLTAAVAQGKPIEVVEDALLALVEKHYKKTDRVVLVGNSIGNDRRFVDAYLPRFATRLHYRMIDVSSFKEVFRDRYRIKVDKRDQHRALDDIRESIRELSEYLKYVHVTGSGKS